MSSYPNEKKKEKVNIESWKKVQEEQDIYKYVRKGRPILFKA